MHRVLRQEKTQVAIGGVGRHTADHIAGIYVLQLYAGSAHEGQNETTNDSHHPEGARLIEGAWLMGLQMVLITQRVFDFKTQCAPVRPPAAPRSISELRL